MKRNVHTILEQTRKRIGAINAVRTATVPDLCRRVREIVIIASSSRGGSSIFAEILRTSPELLHFKGEINPFLVLAGLSYPENGRSADTLQEQDAGSHNSEKLKYFQQEMAYDIGISREVNLTCSVLRNRFIDDICWRLCAQWPEILFEREFVKTEILNSLEEMFTVYGWQNGVLENHQLFHINLLCRLRRRYPQLNPYYYDLPPSLIQEQCPEASENFNSPSSCIIEEPPFVPIVPRHYADAIDVETKPLILKTPSNVYRLPFLKKIFPKARFKILHLVRNPADSINGLFDGWRYNGFFSHNVDRRLNIRGYSDIAPAWGRNWWKYDLPPGWENVVNWPLEYVCGYQWHSAHREILAFLEKERIESLRVKFEDVIGPLKTRQKVFQEIAAWLGITGQEIIKTAMADELPPVMVTTTVPPRQRRWFKKVDLIRPVLLDKGLGVLPVAERLGYSLDEEIGN